MNNYITFWLAHFHLCNLIYLFIKIKSSIIRTLRGFKIENSSNQSDIFRTVD